MRNLFFVTLWAICWLVMPSTAAAQYEEDVQNLTTYLDALLERARKHSNQDSSSFLAKEAYDIAKNTQYHGAFYQAALILANNARIANRPLDAVRYYVEASEQVNYLTDIKQINLVYVGLGDLYMRESIYKSAIENYKKALARDPKNEQVLGSLADAFLAEHMLDSANTYYNLLIDQYRQHGDYTFEVRYHRKMIDLYRRDQNTSMVLKHYLEMGSILEKQGSPLEKALVNNNIGKCYLEKNEYKNALIYLQKAAIQCDYSDCPGEEAMLVNMAVCMFNLGQTRESIDYLVKGIRQFEKINDYASLAYAEEILSGIYFNTNDLYNAQRHNQLMRNYARLAKDPEALARGYQRAADIHFELYALEEAIDFFKLYLTLTDSLRTIDRAQIARQGQLKSELERTERETRSLMFTQEMKARALQAAEKDKALLEATNRALAAEAKQKEEELLKSAERQRLTDSELKVKSLEALQAQSELRNAARLRLLDQQQRLITERLYAEELERKGAEAEANKRKIELDLLQRDNQIKELELRDSENFRRYAFLAGLLSLFILGLLTAGWAWSRRTNRRLNVQNKAIEHQKSLIEQEQQRSETLLLNILPAEVAAELKANGTATPSTYEHVSVVFTDFQSFTKITSTASPEVVLDELNTCFHAFDTICDKYGLEKIKTIGDAYMAAAGVPQPDPLSAQHAVLAALEMQSFLSERKQHDPHALLTEMRIGIHTGPVAAGVVGKNKFAYDIWGDTVNTAARMEEYGAVGKVNITATTAQLLKNDFTLIDRGLMSVHNKGEMQMFFVEPKTS